MSEKSTAEKVAEACGWTAILVVDPIEFCPREFWPIRVDVNWPLPVGGKEWIRDFSPENVERHAVLAAEKYGLFTDRYYADLEQSGGVWSAWVGTDVDDSRKIGSGTFCQTICQAILWFESQKTASSR